MAERWSWEPTPDQASTPSPLQSPGSESVGITQTSPPQLRNADVQGAWAPTRVRLEETLLTCLTQLPHTAATPSPSPSPSRSPTTPSDRAQSDPIRAAPASPLRQSRSGGAASTSTSTPAALSPSNSKPTKRRSRASRRVPTTVVEATCTDFRETVHRLTGIATPTLTPTPKPAPVRPQPARTYPTTLVRPIPQTPSHPTANSRAGLLHAPSAAPPPPPAFWQQTLQQINPTSEQPLPVDPTFVSFSRSQPRPDGTSSPAMRSSGQLGSHSSQIETSTTTTTQAVTTAPAWWDVDAAAREQAQSFVTNPGSENYLSQAVDPELWIDQWLPWTQQDHSDSDFRR